MVHRACRPRVQRPAHEAHVYPLRQEILYFYLHGHHVLLSSSSAMSYAHLPMFLPLSLRSIQPPYGSSMLYLVPPRGVFILLVSILSTSSFIFVECEFAVTTELVRGSPHITSTVSACLT